MSDELAEQGVSIRLLRELEKDDWMLRELYGSVGTLGERTQAALDDLEATLDELVRESSE